LRLARLCALRNIPLTETKPRDKNGRGRPSKYRAEYATQAHKICLLLGATDAELAGVFGVDERTINRWKDDHPDFCQSISRGKVIADADVAERMYRRALGYEHDAVKIFMPAGAYEPVYAPYTEHYPPDTAAASLWLRNRQPGKWRDKHEHEHSGSLTLEQLVVGSLEQKD
jgi:hypothetical protein